VGDTVTQSASRAGQTDPFKDTEVEHRRRSGVRAGKDAQSRHPE
jgi:hypothetical protein